ncbi:hypothetical protein Pmani_011017 [Petrolisthes manimaculis]|uniref:Uncharacterized protein n=1 Tax=Petrolisthes manimaculis TaxID=1843537 RepID=A0AAE1Q1I9_9EUCA|nr:hypothetical protein Pmani_011017 [Petrolisthes manimaculis]
MTGGKDGDGGGPEEWMEVVEVRMEVMEEVVEVRLEVVEVRMEVVELRMEVMEEVVEVRVEVVEVRMEVVELRIEVMEEVVEVRMEVIEEQGGGDHDSFLLHNLEIKTTCARIYGVLWWDRLCLLGRRGVIVVAACRGVTIRRW